MKRSFYSDDVSTFLSTSADAIIGQLAQSHSQHLVQQQTGAWREQIKILKGQLLELPDDAHLFFEFVIPRMGKRVDCVLVVQGIIFVLEFKIGASSYFYADRQLDQLCATDREHCHQRYILDGGVRVFQLCTAWFGSLEFCQTTFLASQKSSRAIPRACASQ